MLLLAGLGWAGFGALADDSILYWFFDEETDILHFDENHTEKIYQLAGVDEGGYAALRVVAHDANGGTTELNIWGVDENGVQMPVDTAFIVPDNSSPPVWSTAKPSYADLTPFADTPGVTFAIEIGMFDDNGDWINLASSEWKSYNELDDLGHISNDARVAPEHGPWTGGSYVVPEPSSGLLLLVGGAFLALRRRRRAK